MGSIADELKSQGPDFGVEVVDLRIGRTDLPEATSQAVYNRMRSARVAQAAQLRAEGEQMKARIQAEADRERTVILAEATGSRQIQRGEGDARANDRSQRGLQQGSGFFDFYRSLEAYGALGRDGTTLVLKPEADFFRFFLDEQGRQPEAGESLKSRQSPSLRRADFLCSLRATRSR